MECHRFSRRAVRCGLPNPKALAVWIICGRADRRYDGREWLALPCRELSTSDAATTAALSKAAEQVAQGKDFQGKLEPLGVIGASLVGPALAEFQKGEIEKWGKAVRGAGLKPQ